MGMNGMETKANEIRKLIIRTIVNARGGHMGSSLSEVEILTSLYFDVMNCGPEDIFNPDRDRFILSKGHGSEGLYCTLALRGFFDLEVLDTYFSKESILSAHPTTIIPGIEMNTGALGHGLSLGVGIALSAKIKNKTYRSFVLTGDGELQEGSNWEAMMAATHFQLGNLVLIIDKNRFQLADTVAKTMNIDPLNDKLRAFGFNVHEVDGHDLEKLSLVMHSLDYKGKAPHAIIANTIKGKGVSFMENVPEWHHKIPTIEEGKLALEELNNE